MQVAADSLDFVITDLRSSLRSVYHRIGAKELAASCPTYAQCTSITDPLKPSMMVPDMVWVQQEGGRYQQVPVGGGNKYDLIFGRTGVALRGWCAGVLMEGADDLFQVCPDQWQWVVDLRSGQCYRFSHVEPYKPEIQAAPDPVGNTPGQSPEGSRAPAPWSVPPNFQPVRNWAEWAKLHGAYRVTPLRMYNLNLQVAIYVPKKGEAEIAEEVIMEKVFAHLVHHTRDS